MGFNSGLKGLMGYTGWNARTIRNAWEEYCRKQ
jgi:hypothetical protein